MKRPTAGFILSCIDYRYVPGILPWARRRGLKLIDLKTDAGGVMALLRGGSVRSWILKNIQVAVRKHGIQTVLLINHQDCAAYGGAKRFKGKQQEADFHARELDKAKALLQKKFPRLTICTFYARRPGGKVIFQEYSPNAA